MGIVKEIERTMKSLRFHGREPGFESLLSADMLSELGFLQTSVPHLCMGNDNRASS